MENSCEIKKDVTEVKFSHAFLLLLVLHENNLASVVINSSSFFVGTSTADRQYPNGISQQGCGWLHSSYCC
jgi:hypothetical protein